MEIGKLRHRIQIQRRETGGADAFGGRTNSWPMVANCWARIEPQTGRQLEYARTFAATVTHTVTIRYLKGLTPAMRVKFGSRVFEINAVIDDEERHIKITLYCTEQAA